MDFKVAEIKSNKHIFRLHQHFQCERESANVCRYRCESDALRQRNWGRTSFGSAIIVRHPVSAVGRLFIWQTGETLRPAISSVQLRWFKSTICQTYVSARITLHIWCWFVRTSWWRQHGYRHVVMYTVTSHAEYSNKVSNLDCDCDCDSWSI